MIVDRNGDLSDGAYAGGRYSPAIRLLFHKVRMPDCEPRPSVSLLGTGVHHTEDGRVDSFITGFEAAKR
jgi:hypothetical protein